ncbi:hypothetical protein ACHWQZ_G003592 [Mnemiopsis leidyi]
MTDAAPVIDKGSESANIAPTQDANGLSGADRITPESDTNSASKRRCLISKDQNDEDEILNDRHLPGSNINFNVNNFVSEIKITVSDYISQQYLVRGSPNYKVLKDKIREYCLSMKPTGMKDDASCSVLYLVYKSLPELKRTDEADSIIRKMIGKHIRNAKYRAKCKLRECKVTDSGKLSAILPKLDSPDKLNPSEAMLHPSLLVMLQSEAYKMNDPLRTEIIQNTVRECQSEIRSNLANTIKTPTPIAPTELQRGVSYGGHVSLAHLKHNKNQSVFGNMLSPKISATYTLSQSNGIMTSIWDPALPGSSSTSQSSSLKSNRGAEVKKEVAHPTSQAERTPPDDCHAPLKPGSSVDVQTPTYPSELKSRHLINGTRRQEMSPIGVPSPCCSPNRLPDLNVVCEHRLKFITGLTYACFLCHDYFERVPAERLVCQHCKKVFSHRHLLLQHNNEAHAFVNQSQ